MKKKPYKFRPSKKARDLHTLKTKVLREHEALTIVGIPHQQAIQHLSKEMHIAPKLVREWLLYGS